MKTDILIVGSGCSGLFIDGKKMNETVTIDQTFLRI